MDLGEHGGVMRVVALLDEREFPFHHDWGAQVLHLLMKVYPDGQRIGYFAQDINIPVSAIALQGQTGEAIWRELLKEAARRTTLRGVFARLLADDSISGFHPELKVLWDQGIDDGRAPDVDPHTPTGVIELSADVIAVHTPVFTAAGVATPARWTAIEFSRIMRANEHPSAERLDTGWLQLRSRLDSLTAAARAKAVVTHLGVDRLGLARLQNLYRGQINCWPKGASIDALLVEAADADLGARKPYSEGDLGYLARFVIAVAAELSVPAGGSAVLSTWIQTLGHSPEDAKQLHQALLVEPVWLLIDLGPERLLKPGEGPAEASIVWPEIVTCTYSTQEKVFTRSFPSGATREGLADALREILANAPQRGPIRVDIAMPAGLLQAGIERWPLFVDAFGDHESIGDLYHPRLRWSHRRHDPRYHEEWRQRAESSTWSTVPDPLDDNLLRDRARLADWMRSASRPAPVIVRHPDHCPADPLKFLLKHGFPFIVWFHPTPSATARAEDHPYQAIATALMGISQASRRRYTPDELAALPEPDKRLVIWDEPRGRDDFQLPPLTLGGSVTP